MGTNKLPGNCIVKPMKRLSLSEMPLLKVSEIIKHGVLGNKALDIKKLFNDHGFKLEEPYQIMVADYPDVLSLQFDNSPSTEIYDTLETCFQGNLFQIMHQTNELLAKYKYLKEDGDVESKIFLYTKPIAFLSERIAQNLNRSALDCFSQLTRMILLHHIFNCYIQAIFRQNMQNEKPLNNEKLDEQLWFTRTVCQALTYHLVKKSTLSMEVFNKLNEKVFRRLPVKLLKKYSLDEIVEFIIKYNKDGQFPEVLRF